MDVNTNAFRVVQKLTAETVENPRTLAAKRGGEQGGPARAKALTPERRREIAKIASLKRWKGKEL